MSTSIEKPDDLIRSGLLIAVRLYHPMPKAGSLFWVDTLAVIDTAAPRTVIQEGVATSIGLEPFDTVTLRTGLARVYESYSYFMSLRFPDGSALEIIEIVEVPCMLHPDTHVKCKIGRDILKYAILTYNGASNMFSLEFKG
jgi:hypothetical protein